MTDFKLFGKCFGRKHFAFFVRKRSFKLPGTSLTAKSRELFCTSCFKRLEEQYKNGIMKQL